ncbi:YceI family protein [Limnobacter sp.]|uniref:YceI family protein n=1 Tax=Limnobacter sp. TaxID=2003368 RepID=UPI00351308B2
MMQAVSRRFAPVAVALCMGVLAGGVGVAQAAPLDARQSRVSATFKQFNVPVSADFKQFEGDIVFDPAKPDQAKASVSVSTASFDLGDPMYNKEVAGKDWLDSKAHPKATFTVTSVKPAGKGYQATGELTIRGITKPVQFPVSIQTAGGMNTFTGKATIKRLDFKVGADGEWADTTLVANEVVIDFKLVAAAK